MSDCWEPLVRALEFTAAHSYEISRAVEAVQ